MTYAAFADGRNFSQFPAADADPGILAGYGRLYAKSVAGVVHVFWQADSGAVYQLSGGSVSVDTDDVTNLSTWPGTTLTDVLNGAKIGADANTNNIATNTANIAANTSGISALQTSKANSTFAVRSVTAATDTLLVTDNNTVIRGNRATAITFTVPGSTLSTGSVVGFFQEAAGKCTLVAGGGMTILSEGGLLSTAAINAYASLLFLSPTLAFFAGSRS